MSTAIATGSPSLATFDCEGCGHLRAMHPGDGACVGEIPNAGICDCGKYRCSAVASSVNPWFKGRLLAADTETTGVDVFRDRIIQAALVAVGGGEPPEKRRWIVDPGIEIPKEATAIHGLSTSDVRAHGCSTEQFLREASEWLAARWTATTPLIAMNAPFDLSLLAAELRRARMPDFRLLGPVIDPRVLDKQADEIEGWHRKGKRQLKDLCFHYGVQLDGAHDACHDAVAAARLVYRMAQRYPQFGNNGLEHLMVLQREWFRDQAKSLDEYFRKQGKAGVESFEWPVRPPPAERLVP